MRWSDRAGLQTYICKRPLGGKPGSFAPPVLNHTYLCVGSDEKMICGSSTQTNGTAISILITGMSGRPSTIADGDYYNPKSCIKIEDENSCIETCIANQLKKPTRPKYGIGPAGTDCQEYTDNVTSDCQKKCRSIKNKK